MIAHNYVVCKMSSTKWPQFRIFLIFQDRELQELRHIINNLKEKNEMGDQGKLWKRKKYYKVSKTFFFSFSVPSRWKSDDNMLNTQNEAAYDINGHKVSRSGSARSFIRGGRKNSWVRNDRNE